MTVKSFAHLRPVQVTDRLLGHRVIIILIFTVNRIGQEGGGRTAHMQKANNLNRFAGARVVMVAMQWKRMLKGCIHLYYGVFGISLTSQFLLYLNTKLDKGTQLCSD